MIKSPILAQPQFSVAKNSRSSLCSFRLNPHVLMVKSHENPQLYDNINTLYKIVYITSIYIYHIEFKMKLIPSPVIG